jgi:circadian clock protein KaiC
VYPRLVAAESRVTSIRRQLSSGLSELDYLLGGGLEEGMSTLVAGPPGSGKSTVAAQFVSAACARGERAAMFLFEEARNNMLNRAESLGLKLNHAVQAGLLTVQQVDPAELTPGQFTQAVVEAAGAGARVIVIDSLNGYLNAVPDERFLSTYLHELLTYLGQRGVVTIVVGVQAGLMGGAMTTAVDASYIADNIITLRYFEMDGEVRQAVAVFKKRGSSHERTLRAFGIGNDGIRVGEVLAGLHGVLTGVPTNSEQAPPRGKP